jgi:shikimate dehydrogenase
MLTNSQTQLNMVIGYPLTHTQSPALHSIVYELLAINAVFLPASHAELAPLVQAMKTLSVGYAAVTMPYKQGIVKYLDEASAEVKMLQAANTVIFREGKLFGYNSDIDGVAYALRHVSLSKKNVLLIGAGGAARAAAYALKNNDANIFWLNRTKHHAEPLAKLFGGRIIDTHQLITLSIDIIINTTPVGMHPNSDQSPLKNYQFHAEQIIFDMIYNPVDTLLMQQAQSVGAQCISGIEMFIAQGLRQIELWREQSIACDALHEKIKEKLIVYQHFQPHR